MIEPQVAHTIQDFDSAFKPLREAILDYRSSVDETSALPTRSTAELEQAIDLRFPFRQALSAEEAIRGAAELLTEGAVHTTHRRYFGLFNPDVHPICVAADALVAAFNPQLAAFSHNPAANLMEQHVLDVFRDLLQWPGCHATFTTGGSEANHSAIIVALTAKVTNYAEDGASAHPVIYVSREAHHSFVKIAHACGIGRRAVREVQVDRLLRMDTADLVSKVEHDRLHGRTPVAVVATAGTTAAGAIDPIDRVGAICREHDLWLHVDAAWGGAGLLSKTMRPLFEGIEHADSVTVDAHKWLSVPMGAGMFFCKEPEHALRAFNVHTGYMPPPAGVTDPYLSTLQWSRRFIGLKLFMAFAALGTDGIVSIVERQARIGDYLRLRLRAAGFEIVNDSPLPLVCFRIPGVDSGAIVQRVQDDGSAWISKTTLSHHGDAIRACITNYRTDESDVDYLIELLQRLARVA